MENEVINVARETKLLGVMVCDNLSWDSNTAYLVKRSNARMRLLHKLVEFGIPQSDLINIYILYVRSILEQLCQVWHSSLTLDNFQDLKRVQKTALRIILKHEYLNYSNDWPLNFVRMKGKTLPKICKIQFKISRNERNVPLKSCEL